MDNLTGQSCTELCSENVIKKSQKWFDNKPNLSFPVIFIAIQGYEGWILTLAIILIFTEMV